MEHESYCGRLGKSCAGVCVGVLLFFAMIITLGWNEFNYVRNQKILMHVTDSVVEAGCTPLTVNTGKPVWVSCPTTHLWDFSEDGRIEQLAPLFGNTPSQRSQTLTAAWIEASSQIYQWVEDKSCEKRSDGHGGRREVCSYTYTQEWRSSPVDSSNFGCFQAAVACITPAGQTVNPRNHGSIPDSLKRKAYPPDGYVTIGQLGLNMGLLSQLPSQTDLPVLGGPVYVPNAIQDRPWAVSEGSEVKFVQDASSSHNDRVGDVRTNFGKSALALSATVSAVAEQMPIPGEEGQAALKPWDTGMSGTMSLVNWAAEGQVSLNEFVRLKSSENRSTTWLLRFAGWLLTFLALQLITGPIALMPQAVPCIGGLIGEVIGCALCCVNFMLSLAVSLVVIGVAWVLARPLVGVLMLAVAGALAIAALWGCRRLKNPSARNPLL